MKPVLTLNYDSEVAIAPYRIVKPGSSNEAVDLATAAADKLVGVSDSLGGDAGGRVDVHLLGVGEVEAGAGGLYGDLLTSDAQGRAVVAGAGHRIVGMAMDDFVINQIVPILLHGGGTAQ